jgi:23S rRNA pseudouridine2605 synthase
MWLGPERPGGHGASKTDRFHVKIVGRERGRTIMEVRISEAKNREIRRVMARIGHTVRDLNRVAIAGKITTKGLEVGAHRLLTAAEVKWLWHASSPEFHASEKASTQAWYEAKEMEKERKRLAKEAKESTIIAAPGRAAPHGHAGFVHAPEQDAVPERPKELRRRPERKGRKPFVPPSGRNAGKALGGNLAGKRRLKQERQGFGADDSTPLPRSAEMPRHPLGDDAMAED